MPETYFLLAIFMMVKIWPEISSVQLSNMGLQIAICFDKFIASVGFMQKFYQI